MVESSFRVLNRLCSRISIKALLSDYVRIGSLRSECLMFERKEKKLAKNYVAKILSS
jgi:hypothetical protein